MQEKKTTKNILSSNLSKVFCYVNSNLCLSITKDKLKLFVKDSFRKYLRPYWYKS